MKKKKIIRKWRPIVTIIVLNEEIINIHYIVNGIQENNRNNDAINLNDRLI
jgi:hypothetical protein